MKKLLLILPLILLAACQSDDEPRVPHPTTITFGTKGGNVSLEWENGQGVTRAEDDIPGEIPESLGVFAYYDKSAEQEVFYNQEVLYFYSYKYKNLNFEWDYRDTNTNELISEWPYTILPGGSKQKEWEKRNYRFLAYSPYSEDGASLSTNDYNFSTLSLTGLSEYSTHDYLISNRVVAVNNTGGKRKTADLVPLEMQHLMARIRFIFKMSGEYREIRRIVINSVSVEASGRENSATITYMGDNTLGTITWGDFTDGTTYTLPLPKENEEDYDVKTNYEDATPFASLYILPQTGFEELTLTVSYTTIDSAGKETRNAKIKNKVILSTPWHLMGGQVLRPENQYIPRLSLRTLGQRPGLRRLGDNKRENTITSINHKIR